MSNTSQTKTPTQFRIKQLGSLINYCTINVSNDETNEVFILCKNLFAKHSTIETDRPIHLLRYINLKQIDPQVFTLVTWNKFVTKLEIEEKLRSPAAKWPTKEPEQKLKIITFKQFIEGKVAVDPDERKVTFFSFM